MDVSEESFEQRHARVLAHLVPAVCHRLNNTVAVTSGMVELALLGSSPESRTENLELALEQSKLTVGQLKRLGSLAGLSESALAAEDAVRALEDAAGLLGAVFQVSGGRFESRVPETAVPVATDRRRLTQLLVLLACSPFAASEEEASIGQGASARRLRLRLEPRVEGAALYLTYRCATDEVAAETNELMRAPCAELHAELSTRSFGGSTCHRLILPGLRS